MKLDIFFEKRPASASVDCFFILTDNNNKKLICSPMEMHFDLLDESKNQEPTLRFGPEIGLQFFPALVDALAKCGYRYESSDVGELKATKTHLEDMRKLVFEK